MAFRNQKIILIALQLAAFWSVLLWYFTRLSSANNEFYGFWSLAAIGLLCLKFRANDAVVPNFGLSVASILVYAISIPFLPPLLQAFAAATSLTVTLSGWQFGKRFHFGVWSLFLLSLPMIASLQFFLGFPLRVLVGEATALLLRLNGLDVVRDGVCLHFGEQSIWIDAPCSGVRMLWAGFFLTALLVNVYNFRFRRSLVAFAAAFAIILAGNIFRAAGLFYLEAGLIELPAFAHEAIGTTAFIITCAGIVFAVFKLKSLAVDEPMTEPDEKTAFDGFTRQQTALFASVCMAAAVAPFVLWTAAPVKTNPVTAEFPTVYEQRALQPLELTEHEQYFMQDFPGETRRYTDGSREFIIRYLTEATRKLHPASDCLAAIGYEIKPLPLKIDAEKQKWSCFTADKGTESLKVCERIYTETGESWTDVSNWYWSALGGENKGYWVMTVAESNK